MPSKEVQLVQTSDMLVQTCNIHMNPILSIKNMELFCLRNSNYFFLQHFTIRFDSLTLVNALGIINYNCTAFINLG